MSSQPPPPHIINNDLLKRILLTTVHRPVSVIGEGSNFSVVSDTALGRSNSSDSLLKMLKPTVREDMLLTTAAVYDQRHYTESTVPVSGVREYEHDSTMEEYSMDALSPQGLNGSGDDPMLTTGIDHDSSGTNEHSNSDPIQSSDACFSVSQMSQERVMKKKGRPAKGNILSVIHGRYGVRCPVCNKTFNNSSALAKHKLTHSDERKYVCRTCSKTFKRQDHLNGHMLTHSSKKPFECKYKDCGKSYCDARSLKRHLEHHHALDSSLPAGNQATLPSYDASSYNPVSSVQTSSSLAGNYSEQLSPVSSASGSSTSTNDKAQGGTIVWPANYNVLDEPLPHKCDLCNRYFKNLPALNGHMRLHGGYSKKDNVADESLSWSSEPVRKKTSAAAAAVSLAIPSGQKMTKLSDVSFGLAQTEPSVAFLPQATATALTHAMYNRVAAGESTDPDASALGIKKKSVFPITSQTAEASRLQELAQRVQLVSMPSSFALNLNSMDEFLKLQEHRLTYLPSESVATLMVDAKTLPLQGEALSQNALTAGNQQFYHITSLPAVSLPSLSLKPPEFSASMLDSYKDGFTSLKSHLLAERKNPGRDECYGEKLDRKDEKSMLWNPADILAADAQDESDHRSRDPDETSTDSAKDTDPEDDTAGHTKELKAHHARRRWASADADRFTSGKAKGSRGDYAALDNSVWPNLSCNFLRRYDREGDSDEADPPTIDDVRDLQSNVDIQADGEFRSPNVTPALLKFRRKHRPEPLIIPPQSSGLAFHSRLRSPRVCGITADSKPTIMPYTPPPMLSPVRNGSGLFCLLTSKSPVSAPVALRSSQTPRRNSRGNVIPPFPTSEVIIEEEEHELIEEDVVETELEMPVPVEPPPETDIEPHMNVGPNYQAEIPAFNPNRRDALLTGPGKEVLVWDPSIMLNVKESEVRAFMDFACCAAVPYNGSNKEYAHHVLSVCGGNIKRAVLKLMQRKTRLSPGHSLHSYIYQEADVWNTKEIEAFQEGLSKFDKDFCRVSQHVGTKSTQKCVQFYYMWKKVATEEHKRLRIVRRKREQENLYNLRSSKAPEKAADESYKNTGSDGFRLPFSAYTVASDNSVGEEQEDAIIAETDLPFSNFNDMACELQYEETVETEEYPCKICGKVFSKVKSRSAHMKTHRPMGGGPQPTDRSRQTYSPQESWQFHPS